MKKLLVLIILVAIITTSGFAMQSAELAVNDISKYNIITGYPDGSLKLEQEVTRAEMAKIILVAMGYDMEMNKTPVPFEDVTEAYWAYGFIGAAYSMGIVHGTSKTTFAPEEKVTYEQVIKMLVCALGYEQKALQQGGYPFGHMMTASQIRLLEGIDVVATNNATRGDIAIIIQNALDIPLMFQVGFGAVSTFDIMNGENGKPLRTFRIELEKELQEKKTDETPQFSGEEYVGRVLKIDELEKTEDGYTFKNSLDEKDTKLYIVNKDTYIYLSENTVKLEEIKEGMYAQCWHYANAEVQTEILKLELMKEKPSGI